MVSNLQFAGVAAYLLWCLFSALSDVLGSDRDEVTHHERRTDIRSVMTELKSPTAVLHEGPRSLSQSETAELEGRDLQQMRGADIDDVIEYVHQGLRKLPDFVTLYKKV